MKKHMKCILVIVLIYVLVLMSVPMGSLLKANNKFSGQWGVSGIGLKVQAVAPEVPTPAPTPEQSAVTPAPTPTPNYPYADIWLWFDLGPETIYPRKTTFTVSMRYFCQDSVVRIHVNEKLIKEVEIQKATFGIDIDLSEYKAGDKVTISSDYVGNRDNPNLAVWTDSKTLTIKEPGPKIFQILRPKKITQETTKIIGYIMQKSNVTLLNGKKQIKRGTANHLGVFTLNGLDLRKYSGKKLALKAGRQGYELKSIEFTVHKK